MTKITVTKQHITKGEIGFSSDHPVALAIQENCNTKVGVGCNNIYFDFLGTFPNPSIPTPPELHEWLRRLDAGEVAEPLPFTFALDIPDQFLKAA